MNATLANTTFLVLCGGAGERMGGADKPLVEHRGKALVDHVLDSVPAETPRLISANRNLDAYRSRGRVITDDEVRAEFALKAAPGPLLGVLGGLSAMDTDWLLVSPGDTPALEPDWWSIMLAAATEEERCVAAHDGERQQHLHLLLHKSVSGDLADYLRGGHYAVWRWLEGLDPVQAHFRDPARFANINRPEDLA